MVWFIKEHLQNSVLLFTLNVDYFNGNGLFTSALINAFARTAFEF